MPRKFFVLLLALTLLLCACAKQPDPIDPTPDAPDALPQGFAVTLAELSVEFVIGERSVDELAQLQKTLPALLIAALAEQNVAVSTVHVTFGASAEATAEALRAGSVQVGFLPAETYLAHEAALHLAAVGQPGTGVAILCDGSPAAQSIRTAVADGTLTWEMLAGASWCVRGERALAWLDAYLAERFNGHDADELSITRLPELPDEDFAMNDVAYDLTVMFFAPGDGATEESIASGVLYDETAVVSAADEIVSSDAFTAALSAALEDESLADALALYGAQGYRADADGTLLADTRLLHAHAHGA